MVEKRTKKKFDLGKKKIDNAKGSKGTLWGIFQLVIVAGIVIQVGFFLTTHSVYVPSVPSFSDHHPEFVIPSMKLLSDSLGGFMETHDKTVSAIQRLYETYKQDLLKARESIHAWADAVDLHQGIDDVDAELIYMRIRMLQPKKVAEFGFGQGLMSVWILHALRDNGAGYLYSFDFEDKYGREADVGGITPESKKIKAFADLSSRWALVIGDVYKMAPKYEPYEYAHIAADSQDVALWAVKYLSEERKQHMLLSFHNVYSPYKGFFKNCRVHDDGTALESGITENGQKFLQFATKMDKSAGKKHNGTRKSFAYAYSHFIEKYQEVMRVRDEALGLQSGPVSNETNWIACGKPSHKATCRSKTGHPCGVEEAAAHKAKHAKHAAKKKRQGAHCDEMPPLNPTLFVASAQPGGPSRVQDDFVNG